MSFGGFGSRQNVTCLVGFLGLSPMASKSLKKGLPIDQHVLLVRMWWQSMDVVVVVYLAKKSLNRIGQM